MPMIPRFESSAAALSSYRRVFCITTIVAVLGLLAGTAADADDLPEKLDLSVQTENEFNVVMFALCRRASDRELRRLESLSDRTISVAAAWEQTRRALLDAKERGVPLEEPIERFIRFTKDRLGAAPPVRWADGLRGAVVTDQKVVIFPTAVGSELYRELSIDATLDGKSVAICGSISPTELSIVAHPQGLTVQWKDEVIPLSRQILEHLCFHGNRSTMLHSSDGIFAALHTEVWHPYCVLRLGNGAHEHPWQCKVWAGGSQITAGGSGFYHFVTMAERNHELLVYGVAYISAYVEGFRKSDGACTFRFGTFWGESLDTKNQGTEPQAEQPSPRQDEP